MNSLIRLVRSKTAFYLLSFISFLIPKDETLVYIFDEGYKKDNSWALAMEISSNSKYSEKTAKYYIGTKIEKNDLKKYPKIDYIDNKLVALYYKLRSKTVIHSFMEIIRIKPMRGQIILNTMHGSPLKNIGYSSSNSRFKYLSNYEGAFSYILAQSEFFKKVVMECYNADESQILIKGYPRNDVLFNSSIKSVESLFPGGRKDAKTIIWMPTWRVSNNNINTESSVSFPILNFHNMEELNEYLRYNNVKMVIKPHPHQLKMDLFSNDLSNIVTVDNVFLNSNGIELYQFLSCFDALLTDYSSVYFDFLLLNRPIGFTIDDYNDYQNKRGFVIEDPLTLMPGKKIYDFDNLKSFIFDLVNNDDKFEHSRVEVNKLVNKHLDGMSSERVLDSIFTDPVQTISNQDSEKM